MAANTCSPGSHAVHGEEALVFNRALIRLADRQRLVIQLHHREGLPFEEVAARMGLSADAARQLWARAVRRLRKERNIREASCTMAEVDS